MIESKMKKERVEVGMLFTPLASEHITFVQFVKFMKDPEIRDQVIRRMEKLFPHLTSTDIEDLR
jgi:hypothetical protein